MIKSIINNLDPRVPIVEVRASKGKHTRAEPCVVLYEQKLIEHADGLKDLEEQMQTWVPHASPSPDRVDALVWLITDLMLSRSPSAFIGGV